MRRVTLWRVLFFFWTILSVAGGWVYLRYLQPAVLNDTLSGILTGFSPGLRCKIKRADFRLAPEPAIFAEKLALTDGKTVYFAVERCEAVVSLRSLLEFKPVLSELILDSPELVLRLDTSSPQGKTGVIPADYPGDDALRLDVPEWLHGISLTVRNGSAAADLADRGVTFKLGGVDAAVKAPSLLFPGKASFGVHRTEIHSEKFPAVTLTECSFSADAIRFNRYDRSGGFKLAFNAQAESLSKALGHPIDKAYDYFPMPRPARMSLSGRYAEDPRRGTRALNARLACEGELVMNGHETPIRIDLPFKLEGSPHAAPAAFALPEQQEDIRLLRGTGIILPEHGIRCGGFTAGPIHIADGSLRMDGDFIDFSGDLLGLFPFNPWFLGEIHSAKFDLGRWIGPCRNMTNGLLNATANINAACGHFLVGGSGCAAWDMQAKTLDIDADISGGCADYLNPDVIVRVGITGSEGRKGHADLAAIFPEALGQAAFAPDYPPSPLPLQKEHRDSSGRCSYHIDISAGDISFGSLRAQNARCMVYDNAEGVPALDIAIGNFYGSKAFAYVALQEDKTLLRAEIENADLADFSNGAWGASFLAGTLAASADLSFSGKTALEMFGSLNGTAEASITGGKFMGKTGAMRPFGKTFVALKGGMALPEGGTEETRLPDLLEFRGTWTASWQAPAHWLTVRSLSPLLFDTASGLPVRAKPGSTSFSCRLANSFFKDKQLPGPVDLSGSAAMSFDTAKNGSLTLSSLTAKGKGFSVGGSVNIRGITAKTGIAGNLSLHSDSLAETARMFGFSFSQAPAEALNAELGLNAEGQKITLKNIRASLGKTSFSGALDIATGDRPRFSGNIALDSVSLPTGGKHHAASAVPADFMRSFDADLSIRIHRADLFGVRLRDFSMPASLDRGNLKAGPATATIETGGSTSAMLQGSFKPAAEGLPARFEGSLVHNAFSVALLPLTASLAGDALLSGTASSSATMNLSVSHFNEFLSQMSGTWKFSAQNGSVFDTAHIYNGVKNPDERRRLAKKFAAAPAGPAAESERAAFTSVSASGALKNSMVSSSDFNFAGPTLKAKGSGTIDLKSAVINAQADAEYNGIGASITITGPLKSPKVDYSIGGLIGALGTIGGAVFGLLATLITAPFKLIIGLGSLF
ncbi:MAG: hypothetical protein J5855_00895 [Mailhella sp.]|nr:hypothetical protein [Mailhella sp.]